VTAKLHISRVWDIIEQVDICMLTTHSVTGFRARPLEARPDREGGLIWFLTDANSDKELEISDNHDVGLVFVDASSGTYLSITGRASPQTNPGRAAEIWKTTDGMWWNGPKDPNLNVLCVTPCTAELWDGPSSKIVTAFEFIKAQLTGKRPNLGENRKATIEMITKDHTENA
jgi:general stress protein 26